MFKRLARLAELSGLEQLDALRTPYEPTPRELPLDDELLVFLCSVRAHPRWGGQQLLSLPMAVGLLRSFLSFQAMTVLPACSP